MQSFQRLHVLTAAALAAISVPAVATDLRGITPNIEPVVSNIPFFQLLRLTFPTNELGKSVVAGSDLYFAPALPNVNSQGFTWRSFDTGEIGFTVEHSFPDWQRGSVWIPLRRLGEDPQIVLEMPRGFRSGFLCALASSNAPWAGIVHGSIRNNIERTGAQSWLVKSTIYELPGPTSTNLGLGFYRAYQDGRVDAVAQVSPPHQSFTRVGVNYYELNGNYTVSNSLGFVAPASGVPANWNVSVGSP